VSGVEPLTTLLALERTGEHTFSAPTHGPDAGVERIFGGHVSAQALLAATHTVDPDRAAHSVHCAFVRSGRPGVPLDISVARDRDGRAFSTRQVTVRQRGTVVFEMTASFQVAEPGDDWTATPMPDLPGPDEVASGGTFLAQLPTFSVFEWKILTDHATNPGSLDPAHPAWVRAVEPLPDDPALHRAVIAAISDLGSVRGTVRPGFDLAYGSFTGASLDHALWFHRPARADEWLLTTMHPLSNHAGRGLGIGRAWSPDGTHVCTWVQESLLRIT
jgi:acyl-CoA thioesterase-2